MLRDGGQRMQITHRFRHATFCVGGGQFSLPRSEVLSFYAPLQLETDRSETLRTAPANLMARKCHLTFGRRAATPAGGIVEDAFAGLDWLGQFV